MLAGAIDSGTHSYDATDEALIEALYLPVLLSHYSGRPEFWRPVSSAIAHLKPTVPPLLSALYKTVADPARLGRSGVAELQPLLADMADETDPGRIIRSGTACLYVDRLGDLREPSWRVVRLGRDGGSVRRHLGGLFHLNMDDYVNGKWDEALELADEGTMLCATYGYAFFAWYFWAVQALIAGVRGEGELCGELTGRITSWAAPRGGCVSPPAMPITHEPWRRWATPISKPRTGMPARSVRPAPWPRMCRTPCGWPWIWWRPPFTPAGTTKRPVIWRLSTNPTWLNCRPASPSWRRIRPRCAPGAMTRPCGYSRRHW
ncbi:hypothetical protein [Amycolatopsis sp. FDAARGOS 1241]|uniref:hypothetical protein n=1 Tax=Amycolatopsis sp. FDAARGOS 1241 TaxID=2778070 RepID=UPI00195158D5|nr:hypothetical protein [Amycolatopsis sp. FDAARGOS 1241]QRP42736.1 hypothetical protein I6J71_24945 [Amycolatopsis sp. FDAARGOS 1241]